MNRGALKTQAADFAGDKNQTRYSSTQYNTAADRAQEQFATDTRALWKDKSWSHAANDADEDLPTDFMYEDWVTYNGIELDPISRHELTSRYGEDWTAKTSTSPSHFIIDPEQAVKEIVLFPIPTEAKTLILRYYPLPAAMAADTNIPLNSSDLMVQFHIGLAAYMAWLLMTGEQSTPAIVEKRRELLRIYTDSVNKATDTFKNTASAPIKITGSRFRGVTWS